MKLFIYKINLKSFHQQKSSKAKSKRISCPFKERTVNLQIINPKNFISNTNKTQSQPTERIGDGIGFFSVRSTHHPLQVHTHAFMCRKYKQNTNFLPLSYREERTGPVP